MRLGRRRPGRRNRGMPGDGSNRADLHRWKKWPAPQCPSDQGRVFGCFPLLGRNQFLRFKLSELDRCQSAETRMRTAMVVIVAPRLDGCARFGPDLGIHAR